MRREVRSCFDLQIYDYVCDEWRGRGHTVRPHCLVPFPRGTHRGLQRQQHSTPHYLHTSLPVIDSEHISQTSLTLLTMLPGFNLSVSSFLLITALIGNPFPSPLAISMMSGLTPLSSIANNSFPLLALPNPA